MGGLATDIIKLLEEKDATKGDYFKLFHKVEAYFEVFDLFYGINASAFNMRDSLIAMPNPKHEQIRSAFRAKLTEAALANLKDTYGTASKAGSVEQSNLHDIFLTILDIINYKLIRPAAPPRASRFYAGSNNVGPIRAILTPDLDMSPPPLCNVFFPEQV